MDGNTIYLKAISLDDTNYIIKWRNSAFVKKNFIYQKDLTVKEHLAWMEKKVFTHQVYQFIITIKANKLPIGSVYLRDIDNINHKAEYGIFIGEKEFLGKGIGTEVATLIVTFAFDTLYLNKIFLRVFANNLVAIKSYEKAGFKREGLFKEDVCIDSKYYDIIFMSILSKERNFII